MNEKFVLALARAGNHNHLAPQAGGKVAAALNLVGRQRHIELEISRYPHSRSEEHPSELQSLMRNTYDVFRLKTKRTTSVSRTADSTEESKTIQYKQVKNTN